MPEFYVKVEAVNLDNFISDVQDLNTIRGGGLLLLHAIDWLKKQFAMHPISTGASAGLFKVTRPDDPRASIETFIREHDRLKYATFAVAAVEESDFGKAREELTSLIRWQQWQRPTLAAPSPNATSAGACEFDLVRPGTKRSATVEGRKRASASVVARRRYGKAQKQRFVASELELLDRRTPGLSDVLPFLNERKQQHQDAFAHDFEELSEGGPGNLNRKIAVIYLDGNRFGAIQRTCSSEAAVESWDAHVKRLRREALLGLMQRVIGDEGWRSGKDRLRFETLLWGGDDLMWVVPAWKGWEVVQLFYDVSKNWSFSIPSPQPGDAPQHAPMTHGGGIVFCHHNAPIHRIRSLVGRVAGFAKQRAKQQASEGHDARDLFAALVLESFDDVGDDLDRYLHRLVPKGSQIEDLVLNAARTMALDGDLAIVKGELPRTKLHEIARVLLRSGVRDARPLIQKTRSSLHAEVSDALERVLEAFAPVDRHDRSAGWAHLAQLWDYVALGKEVRP